MTPLPSGIVERRRRGPRTYLPPTIDAIRRGEGRPLRLRDLAALTGFSKPKVRADLQAGYVVSCVRCGSRTMYVIQYAEAQRYLRALGML